MAEHEEHKEGQAEGGHGGGGHGGGAHGGAAHEEHEGAPEWLISFADNVALMMGFFVILLAMNMQKPKMGGVGGEAKMGGAPTEQMIDFVIAMRKEFNNPIDLSSDNPAEAPLRRRIRDREAGISNQAGEPGPGKESQAINPTDFTNGGGTIQFENDSSSLSDKGKTLVRNIADRIGGQRFMIEVRGHVSPHEAGEDEQKAFGLAHARAFTVAKELQAQGIPRSHLRLSSCADNQRKTTREQSYDAEQDQRNQRVEVIVTGEPAVSDGAQLLPNKPGAKPPDAGSGGSEDEHSASSHRN